MAVPSRMEEGKGTPVLSYGGTRSQQGEGRTTNRSFLMWMICATSMCLLLLALVDSGGGAQAPDALAQASAQKQHALAAGHISLPMLEENTTAAGGNATAAGNATDPLEEIEDLEKKIVGFEEHAVDTVWHNSWIFLLFMLIISLACLLVGLGLGANNPQAVLSADQCKGDGGATLPLHEVVHIFKTLDKNGDGHISNAECLKGIQANPQIAKLLGMPPVVHSGDGTKDVYSRIFGSIDVDNDKTIELSEMLRHFGHANVTEEQLQRSMAMFQYNETVAKKVSENLRLTNGA